MFGKVKSVPQNEDTPFHPRSPYGVAKLFAHWSAVNYREAYGMFVASGILFNHESPLRGRRIRYEKNQPGRGKDKPWAAILMKLGNLDAKRDWGFAGEFVEGMWRMLQAERAGDVCSGNGNNNERTRFYHTVIRGSGINLEWANSGDSEVGRCASNRPDDRDR